MLKGNKTHFTNQKFSLILNFTLCVCELLSHCLCATWMQHQTEGRRGWKRLWQLRYCWSSVITIWRRERDGVGSMEEEPRVSTCGVISSGPSPVLVGPLRKRSFRGTVYNMGLCNSIGLWKTNGLTTPTLNFNLEICPLKFATNGLFNACKTV